MSNAAGRTLVNFMAPARCWWQGCPQLNSDGHFNCEMLASMAELIVMERIDGSPVAWRCSECRQSFSVHGKLTAHERHTQVNAEFKAHMQEQHKAGAANRMAFAAAAPLPD